MAKEYKDALGRPLEANDWCILSPNKGKPNLIQIRELDDTGGAYTGMDIMTHNDKWTYTNRLVKVTELVTQGILKPK